MRLEITMVVWADHWDHWHLGDLKLEMELQYFKTNGTVIIHMQSMAQWRHTHLDLM